MRKPARQLAPQPLETARQARSRLAAQAPVAVVAAVIVLFVVLKLYSLHVVVGDEHLWFYMAWLVDNGLVPYRDFFFTHPPLQIYAAAAVFRLFGPNLTVGKLLLPNLSCLVAGLLVFAVGRRALGAAEGALACALFLLSFDPLRISTHFTGGDEAFALAMVGFWLGYRDRPVLAGAAFGLGTLVAIYVLPGAAAVALLLWLRSPSRALRFAVALAAVFLCVSLLFCVLAGWNYVHQVFLSQFEKEPEGSLAGYRLYHRLGFILYENMLMSAGSVAGAVLLAWEVRRREALILLLAWFGLYWAFYLSIPVHHAYYFLFIMPVLAWFSAHAYLEIARGAGGVGGGPGRVRAVVAAALVVVSVAAVETLYVPFWLGRHGPRVERYQWSASPYLPWLDPLIRAAFWQDSYDPRRPPNGITRYLQHESEHMTAEDALYTTVRQHTAPGDAIFGEIALTPLVALETGRRVAANLVDTSAFRLYSGRSRLQDWIDAIERDHVRLLVVREGRDLMKQPEFHRYTEEKFETAARVRDAFLGEILVLRRRGAS